MQKGHVNYEVHFRFSVVLFLKVVLIKRLGFGCVRF
jgi:hypothetical protein